MVCGVFFSPFFSSWGCKQLGKIDIFKKTTLPWRWIKIQNLCLVPKNVILSDRVEEFWLKRNPGFAASFERVTFYRRCCAVPSCMAVGNLQIEHKKVECILSNSVTLSPVKGFCLDLCSFLFPTMRKMQQGSIAEGTCFEGHALDGWEC